MPKIAELREIDGAIWARVEATSCPIQLLSSAEIVANRQREMRQLDEIERLQTELKEFAELKEYAKSLGQETYLELHGQNERLRAALRDARQALVNITSAQDLASAQATARVGLGVTQQITGKDEKA